MIPLIVLVLAYWVIVRVLGNVGFRKRPALGRAYIFLGPTLLGITWISGLWFSGDYHIWQARVPGVWIVQIGYLVVYGINVASWLSGRKFFNSHELPGSGRLLSNLVASFIPLLLLGFVVDNEYNELNQHYLDKRRPQAYVVVNPEAIKHVAALGAEVTRHIGHDLAALLADPKFEQVLRTKEFYKQDFDEPFQLVNSAIIYGYKMDTPPGDPPVFQIIRFPSELADALRFQLSGEEK